MRMLLLAAASSLALAGCTTIDRTIRDTLPEICTAATAAHVAFGVYASNGDISPETVLAERLAWQALQPLCVEPKGQTSATVVVAAAQAYATISAALSEARSDTDGTLDAGRMRPPRP